MEIHLFGPIDIPRDTLNPVIWDLDSGQLRSEVRSFILTVLMGDLVDFGYNAPEKWIAGVKLIGSITGLQWTNEADIDVTVLVDYDSFRIYESCLPDIQNVDIITELGVLFAKSINGRVYPNTQHPVNYYAAGIGTQVYGDAVYDVVDDQWDHTSDFEYPEQFDLEQQFPEAWANAQSWAAKIDLSVGSVRRDLLELEALRRSMEGISLLQLESIEQQIHKRIAEIDAEISSLVADYETIRQQRLQAFIDAQEFEVIA